jgi:uncharacterized protein YukE
MLTIHARPNLNGNTAADFQSAAQRLRTAVEEVEAALRQVNRDVLHGRNYRTVVNPELARDVDGRAFQQAGDSISLLMDLASAIGEASH